MKTLRHILVAIKNPAARSQPALRKAAQLAAGSGARLTLFHALTAPLALDPYHAQGQTLQQMQREWRARAMEQLEKRAAPLRQQGLRVEVSSEWDFPAYEAVIRQAQRQHVDLIAAERHATRHLLPSLLRFNDWELLRRSPLPVLLVKRGGAWKRPAVLAAIDPSHDFAKPARLDAAILSAASLVAGSLHGRLHVAHAWPGAPVVSFSELGVVTDVSKESRRRARKAFDAQVDGTGLAGVKRHFVEGDPVSAIPKLARGQRAGLVVMGAVSRSGLQRLLVGNVAEQVLDSLACDVLVVKPAHFASRVKPQRRGVQLLPAPSYA